MKEVVLTKTTHNYMECYKDESKVFMVCKLYKNCWRVYYAKTNNDEIINELRCWGYKEFTKTKTLKEAKEEIKYLLSRPIFDEFQTNLLKNIYDYERYAN